MESLSIMDKKSASRANALSNKNGQEPNRTDFNGRKNSQQYPRKREYEKFDNGKRLPSNHGGRTGQRYVRPREKMDCQVDEFNVKNIGSEFGSLQKFGSKKQNITHLLNWWGPGPVQQHGRGQTSYDPVRRNRRQSSHLKYNKEHFLQANCQFVVSAGEDYSECKTDPDHLVDWIFVEEVRLHVTETPSCPICLFPPTAPKVTRCGHIYCFPCILHYLALSDDKWRKCPICFEAIHKEDLKSVKAIVHKDCCIGEEVELQLMRRERDSLIPTPVSCYVESKHFDVATYSTPLDVLPFSKLIVASKREVVENILEKETKELQTQLELEGDQPEACFIEEALSLISKRKHSLFNTKSAAPSLAEATAPPTNEISVQDVDISHSLSGLSLSSPDECPSSPTAHFADLKDHNLNVTPEDLDISHLQACSSQDNKNCPKQTYFFYQASSGAHVYLHALNVQMLVKGFGSLENCPLKIKGRVVEKETASMRDELRNRLRYLRHLPLTCNFDVVEIELKPPLVSEDTLLEFQPRLGKRERERRRRAKEEKKLERKAQAENDRMMGRSRGTKLNLQSEKHFPTFAEDPPLISGVADALSEAENKSLSSSFSSTESPDKSAPSFAQMIRDGQKSVSSTPSWPPTQPKATHQISNCDDSFNSLDDEGCERVPDYSSSFSAAFDKALNDATKKAACVAHEGVSRKKKKKKGILLMSSGGL